MQGRKNVGRFMENVFFLQFFRRSNAQANFSIIYLKEYGKSERAEVDSLLTKGGLQVELINVTSASSGSKTYRRKLRDLGRQARNSTEQTRLS